MWYSEKPTAGGGYPDGATGNLSVTHMLPGPRDGVPETGTPSPIGNAFEFLSTQDTVRKAMAIAKINVSGA